MIRNLVDTGIEEIKIQKAVGLTQMTFLIKRIKSQWIKGKTAYDESKGQHIPMKETAGKNITFGLEQKFIAKIDELSKKLDLKRSKLIEEMIDMGLKDLKIMKKIGAVTITAALRNIHDKWKERFKEAEKCIESGEMKIKSKE